MNLIIYFYIILSKLGEGFTNCVPLSPSKWKISLCCAAYMFLFSSISPQGSWSYLNKTSSNSAALFTKSVRRQKEISNSPLRNGTLYFSFFIYYLRHGRNKTYKERQRVQNSHQCIPGSSFWIIYLQQPFWRRHRVYFMWLRMTAENQYSKVWFSELFNALLVCPLISPPVQVCLSTHLKTTWPVTSLSQEPMKFFSKAKLYSHRVAVDLCSSKCYCCLRL